MHYVAEDSTCKAGRSVAGDVWRTEQRLIDGNRRRRQRRSPEREASDDWERRRASDLGAVNLVVGGGKLNYRFHHYGYTIIMEWYPQVNKEGVWGCFFLLQKCLLTYDDKKKSFLKCVLINFYSGKS